MRKATILALVLVMALTIAVMPAQAQTRNVTFVINTASVPDTITSNADVRVTGGHAAIDNWGAGIKATQVGGDYWKATVAFTQGDTVNFKFRIAGGWESDLDGVGYGPNGNRHLVVGKADTTLPVQFYNPGGGTKAQYFRPWGTSPDTMKTIYFRVNMLGLTSKPFDATKDTVGVRGDKSGGSFNDPNFGWSPTRFMTREGSSGMAGQIWSGAIKLNKKNVAAGNSVDYKFLIGYDWGRDELGGQPNRNFKIPDGNDTTLAWVWYNNEAPIVRVNPDTVTVTFTANMTTAIQKQSFTATDSIRVEAGYFGTSDSTRIVYLTKSGLTQNYIGSIKMPSKIGAVLDYQYYLVRNGASFREYYFNFDYNGAIAAEQERRQVTLTSKTQSVIDNVVSVTDPRRQPYFENQRKLTKSVTVTWQVDLRPAIYAVKAGKTLTDIQGTITITHKDSVRAKGLAMNGPGSNPAAGGWAGWGASLWADTTHRLWDDGTHGDVKANDTIYTRQYTYTTANNVGQIFKFGIGGGDNESGFGLNHLENIDDTNPTYTLNAQFGSINPKFYSAWDFTNGRPATGVIDGTILPNEYSLLQNYPNPFNPSTSISFVLPVRSQVTVKVYNVLGQVVATLADGVMNAGVHDVTFNASKFASGVYFYELRADNFSSLKKMVLMK